MTDTKFGSITYTRSFTRISGTCLKFLKTGGDQPAYYHGEEGRFKKCSSPLISPSSDIDKAMLVISIECVDVRKIIIYLNDVKYLLEF